MLKKNATYLQQNKNIFKHSKLANILLNNKYTLYTKKITKSVATPRQNSTSVNYVLSTYTCRTTQLGNIHSQVPEETISNCSKWNHGFLHGNDASTSDTTP